MALPVEERLRIAKDMVARYADITDQDLDSPEAAKATIGTDDPAIVLEAKVGFVEHTWKRNGKRRPLSHRPARILVGTKAINKNDDVATNFEELGAIEFDENDDGEPRGPVVGRPFSTWEEDSFDLNDSRATDMIEIIDAAAKGLIEDRVAHDRKFVGSAALAGVSAES